MPRGRKPGKGKNYFDQEVNDAILEFNNSDDKQRRDIIFYRIIYPALNKLVENIIHKWKFYNYESNYADLKADTVTYLFEQLGKYRPETGSKAFSYFTIVARNYLFKRSKDLMKSQIEVGNLDLVDPNRNIMVEVTGGDYVDDKIEFNRSWINDLENKIDCLFKSKRERAIAASFVNIFNSGLDIDNKKLFYIYLREQTGLENKTQPITKIMSVLKQHYLENLKTFQLTGEYEKADL